MEERCQAEENPNSNVQDAFYIFMAAAALSGIGNVGLQVLSVSYIDENVPRKKSPLYVGKSRKLIYP